MSDGHVCTTTAMVTDVCVCLSVGVQKKLPFESDVVSV